jgi:hypothetical protein
MTDKTVPAPIKAAIDSILAKEDILHQNSNSLLTLRNLHLQKGVQNLGRKTQEGGKQKASN